MDSGDLESFDVARYSVRLGLPPHRSDALQRAQEAVRREYRESVKWKKLRCRGATLLSESEKGAVFVLDVGHTVEFDWTWEGAIAFRPLSLKEFDLEQRTYFDSEFPEAEIEDSLLWHGEVVEVDETGGRLFVVVANRDRPPTAGSFYVRPFEFLAFLNSVYNEPAFEQLREVLPERLHATEGGVHPAVSGGRPASLSHLEAWWTRSWSVLWGPPGTGKTYTTGQQVARCLADPSERVLVLSTTNRATDAAALAIGRAAREHASWALSNLAIRRIGKGASLKRFREANLEVLLHGTETEFLAHIDELVQEIARAPSFEQKAIMRKRIKELREEMMDSAQRNFLDKQVRVVIGTAFKATTFLNQIAIRQMSEQNLAPFTTVFIDEAGLISRAAAAVLSLLGARRVVLVGDSKQLAPISRISRVLPTSQARWLASSALGHLDSLKELPQGVHLLREQYRMHDDIAQVVSGYQYRGALATAADVLARPSRLPSVLADQPRALWYVLDDETDDLPQIRAERGPGNRSWQRPITARLLDKFFADPQMGNSNGLFITPFRAQAKAFASYLADRDLQTWTASTVHSQQGAEADIVVFDSVNAGSYGWPYDEWKRLVNVAISRARESVIIIASRNEMDEPYLRPLVRHLRAGILMRRGTALRWQVCHTHTNILLPTPDIEGDPNSLGMQLTKRKSLRPVFSQEQQRLCELALDGKPRLVRGVAGSGKTIVLAHWLLKTVKRFEGQSDYRIWAVYANRALHKMIADSIALAWDQESDAAAFPWEHVELIHIRDLLEKLLPSVGLRISQYEFDYDRAAAEFLEKRSEELLPALCDAIFIDEAQDLGPDALKLLSRLVRQADDTQANSRSINIFYDNAQNLYGRGTPKWSELGLDMRGRSTVMKESFRSTKPITEFALNVLYRLKPPDDDPDHKELVARGLVERTERSGNTWWNVRFSQVEGPHPTFRLYPDMQRQFEAFGADLIRLISHEKVSPADICILFNGKNIPWRLENDIAPLLAAIGVQLTVQTHRHFDRNDRAVLATTTHSFKGFDAEVILIPAVDQFAAKGKGVLANLLYVAMTRARSVLVMYGHKRNGGDGQRICNVIDDCLNDLHERPEVDAHISIQDDLIELLSRIGNEHREWLISIVKQHGISQEPLLTQDSEVIAEPLFWFRTSDKVFACLGPNRPRTRILQRLEDCGVSVLEAGQTWQE